MTLTTRHAPSRTHGGDGQASVKRDAEAVTYRDVLNHLRTARYHLRRAAEKVDTLPGCSNREWRRYMEAPVETVDEIGTELVNKRTMRKVPE